ncbi:preprotein translocase subunit SecY [Candidatus Bathyarchaeota archaeon RBG_13_52_12]|nr:MAG: preprotein translocase subunit SecY [Candidatus Bathyarchaeota archaeon RBG_13_52_12]
MIALRFLELFKPISRIIPEVKPPERKVSFQNRLIWTLLALLIYFIMSEIPLYGIPISAGGDSFTTYRVIFASTRGTLMELGIGPIVTAGLIIQLLAGSDIISFDRSSAEDRGLFTTASKFFSILMIVIQAVLYIISGQYGTATLTKSLLIFAQLLVAGIIIMLLDELVQKGWGIGSGISLFIVGGITANIWWMSFSFMNYDGRAYGAIIAFFQGIWMREPVLNWFYRSNGAPDMIGFFTTLVVFLFVIYVEGMRVELPISHSQYRGYRGRMPIKLLYVSNIPVILAYALFANFQLVGQFVWQRWNLANDNNWLNWLGTFQYSTSGQPYATGGLVYYLTSPGGIQNVLDAPLKALVYAVIVIVFCVIFSMTWLEIGGLGAEDMADQLLESGMQVPGFRRNKQPIVTLLNRYIPTITIIGGAIVGALAAISDFFGVFGSGMGALLAVSILYQYYQTMVQEQVADLYPFLRGTLQ